MVPLTKTIPFRRRGLLFVLSSPSGAGKTTITRALLAQNPETLIISVSATTRLPRPGEVDGHDYFFKDQAAFQQMINDGAFLEHAKVFGHYYGTPQAAVEQALRDSKDVIFDIDWQGTQKLKQKLPTDLVSVFILPPDRTELERRLRARQQDDDSVIAARMQKASDEISHYSEYDYIVVNSDIDASIRQVQAILEAERCKRRRLTDLADFVQTLTDP